MTNKPTIDGVSRELLVRLCNFHATGWEDVGPEIKELRALLDGPTDPKPTGLSQGWNLTRKHDGFVVGHQSVAYPPDEKAIERAERDGYVWIPFLVPAAQPLGVTVIGAICGGDAEYNTVNIKVGGSVPSELWTLGNEVTVIHGHPIARPQVEHTAVSFLERMLKGSGDDRLAAWQGEMAMLLEHIAENKPQVEPATQPGSHPIPQYLRDRFSAIEDEAMHLKGSAVFTQMRTAVQAYFMRQPAAQARISRSDLAANCSHSWPEAATHCAMCGTPRPAAAQPQGEPVAIGEIIQDGGFLEVDIYDYKDLKRGGRLPLGTKLYAEQTAPVAAVLPERSPKDYAIEHAEYMAKSVDDVLAKFQAYGVALLAVDEGGDDGEGELLENIDSARGDLQESLVELRSMVYEFRKRSDKSR